MTNLQSRFPGQAIALFVLAAKPGDAHNYCVHGPHDRVLDMVRDIIPAILTPRPPTP